MSLARKIAQSVIANNTSGDQLVDVLTNYKLLSLLPAITNEVAKLGTLSAKKDIMYIESPFPLNDAAVAKIKRIVGNDLTQTEVTINKNILSGFKARFKGKLYDGSGERIIKKLTNQ